LAVKKFKEQKLWDDLHPNVKRGLLAMKDDLIIDDGRAIDPETGEDVSHLFEVSLVTTDEQIRGLEGNTELQKHEIENGKFVFVFFRQMNCMDDRFPSLTRQDKARLLYIGTFIEFENGRLQAPNGKRIYNKDDIQQLVGMSRKRFNEFFRKLKTEGIIEEKETGELFMNSTVFYRGFLKNHEYDISELDHTRIFRKTVRDLYEKFQGRQLGQLAVIYSIIPYLNLRYNVVCNNPAERNEELIQPMGLEKLTEILGYSNSTTLRRTLNNIKIDGEPVFAFVQNPNDRRSSRIIVNPRVVFAGDGEALKAIKVLFN